MEERSTPPEVSGGTEMLAPTAWGSLTTAADSGVVPIEMVAGSVETCSVSATVVGPPPPAVWWWISESSGDWEADMIRCE